jgi:hypothetical protein
MPRCQGTCLNGRPCAYQAKPGREFFMYHEQPRRPNCRICRDPRRAEIEAMLAGGARPAAVNARFRLAPETLWYHRARHMPPAGGEGAGGAKPLRPEPGANP